MLEYTKCDAIMIGRGVLGNPWLIKEIDTYLKQGIIIELYAVPRGAAFFKGGQDAGDRNQG